MPSFVKLDPRLKTIFSDAQPALVITNNHIHNKIDSEHKNIEGLKEIEWLSTEDLQPEIASEWKQPAINQDSLAFLQYTSGSTSAPKGVMVSHGNILYNEEMIKQAFNHSNNTVVVGWLPFFHDMGLMGRSSAVISWCKLYFNDTCGFFSEAFEVVTSYK